MRKFQGHAFLKIRVTTTVATRMDIKAIYVGCTRLVLMEGMLVPTLLYRHLRQLLTVLPRYFSAYLRFEYRARASLTE